MIGHVLLSMNEMVTCDYSKTHQALDIVSSGYGSSDVISYGDGVIEMVVNNVKYTNHKTKGTATYGNFVKIRHDDGKITLYAHLKYGTVTVFKGQRVYKGQKLATMGATGNAYGTHLHFEVRNSDNVKENPRDYLYNKVETTSLEPEVVVSETKEIGPTNNPQTAVESNKVDDGKAETYTAKHNTNDNITVIKSTEKVISNNNYLVNSNYSGGSIVDGLKQIGYNSSYDYRSKLALKNGINNYHGSYEQNIKLLNLLKQGKLKA